MGQTRGDLDGLRLSQGDPERQLPGRSLSSKSIAADEYAPREPDRVSEDRKLKGVGSICRNSRAGGARGGGGGGVGANPPPPPRPLLASAWLHAGPIPRPEGWVDHVHAPQTEAELERLRHSVRRGAPFGSEPWVRQTAGRLGLEYTLRPPGRPANAPPTAGTPSFETSNVPLWT
jgi:hypothetical protein